MPERVAGDSLAEVIRTVVTTITTDGYDDRAWRPCDESAKDIADAIRERFDVVERDGSSRAPSDDAPVDHITHNPTCGHWPETAGADTDGR